VAGLTRKKKSFAQSADALERTARELQALSRTLATAIDRDAASYKAVLDAYRLPRETEEEQRARDRAIQAALKTSVEVPLDIARYAASLFEKLGQLEPMSAPSMLSDVRVGRMMAAVAVRGALENVNTNLESVTDQPYATRARAEAQTLASRVSQDSGGAGR
jgi:methenyltetrahydrofolate cyclohydrolase